MNQPNQDQLWQNLTNQNTWVRLAYMLIYGIILHIAGVLMWILCGVQFIFSLIFGEDNLNLRNMGATISRYIAEALAYVSYNSDNKPFPFNSHAKSEDPETNTEDVIDAEVVQEKKQRPEPEPTAENDQPIDPNPSTSPSSDNRNNTEKPE